MKGLDGVNVIKYNGDILGSGAVGTQIVSKSNLQPSDIAKVGDIVFDQFPNSRGIDIGFWQITAMDDRNVTVQGISSGFTIPKGDKGDKGDRGPQGKTGATGPQGPQGIAGSAMTNLTWDVLDLRDSKFNPNYWYPCNTTFFSAVQFTEIVVGVNLYNGMPNDEGAPWGSHSYANGTAFECFTDVIMNHNAYGRIAPAAYLLANEFKYVKDNLNPVHVDQNPNSGGYVLWLRGGAKYNVGTTTIRDQGTGNRWVVNSSDWTLNGISFPVQKKEPNNFQVCGNNIRYNDLRKVGGN